MTNPPTAPTPPEPPSRFADDWDAAVIIKPEDQRPPTEAERPRPERDS